MRVIESRKMIACLPHSTSRRARSATISATAMWFSAERSAEEAMTSPRTLRRKSVISSGRSSISSTMTVTSGSLTDDRVRHALQERRLAGLGRRHDQAALARGRWAPAGPSRGRTSRPASVSSCRWSCGSIEMSSLNAGRWRKRRGLEALDRLDPLDDRPAAVDGEPGDQRAGLEAFARDQVARDQRIAGRGR